MYFTEVVNLIFVLILMLLTERCFPITWTKLLEFYMKGRTKLQFNLMEHKILFRSRSNQIKDSMEVLTERAFSKHMKLLF